MKIFFSLLVYFLCVPVAMLLFLRGVFLIGRAGVDNAYRRGVLNIASYWNLSPNEKKDLKLGLIRLGQSFVVIVSMFIFIVGLQRML